MRENFSLKDKEILAKRVGYLCSNPACKKLTCGPSSEPTRVVNIGVAAHITAASKGGPRYDDSLSNEERKSIENGIWLCQNCGKLIDNDPDLYSIELLGNWKNLAESLSLKRVSESYNTDYDWEASLSTQITSFSRVDFHFPFMQVPKNESEEEFAKMMTRILFQMITCSYLDLVKNSKKEGLIFALSLNGEFSENKFSFGGELITHVTSFAFYFGQFVNFLKNQKIDELAEALNKYPKINIKREVAFGKFMPYKISRVNPAKIYIEYIEKEVYHLKGDLSTSDLILYFSAGVNRKVFLLDDQNELDQIEKTSRLLDETIDGFDLTEIWIDPTDCEKWSFN